jgi:threonine dehydratase
MPVVAPNTIADGLRGSIGVRNFELLKTHVDDMVTVSEAQIIDAMRIVLADCKILIEPSSAVAVAAVLDGKLGRAGQRVGLIISGGNVDLDTCPFLRGERRA